MRLTSYEKRNYVMNDKADFVILGKIKELEKRGLGKADKAVLKLIRTQLKRDWRTPLVKYLDKLLKR